jgi:hypothetical protein
MGVEEALEKGTFLVRDRDTLENITAPIVTSFRAEIRRHFATPPPLLGG